MENFDAQLERRVWQRVRADAPPVSLQAMAAAEHTTAAVYLMLSRMMQGQQKEQLRRLFQREREHGRLLSGMSRLSEGKPLSFRAEQPEGDRLEIALRKCYVRTLQAAGNYAARENDPDFGHVFRELRRQEEENCTMILQILGNAP